MYSNESIKRINTILLVITAIITFFFFRTMNGVSAILDDFNIEQLEQNFNLVYIFFTFIVIIAMSFFLIAHYTGKTSEVEVEAQVMVEKKKELSQEELDAIEAENKEKIELIYNDLVKKTPKDSRNFSEFADSVLRLMATKFEAVQALFYLLNTETNKFENQAQYAYYSTEPIKPFTLGEGLNGQVAKDQEFLYINNLPENYIKILSGLGSSSPQYLALIPVMTNDRCIALIELASFRKVENSEIILKRYSNYLSQIIGDKQ